jgi:predicted dehydrogenase
MLLAANARLTAVMVVDAGRADRLRIKYGAAKAYTDSAALVADPEVDAVYIASPVVYHYEQTMQAIAAGKHVLVEKPIALTVEEGRAVSEAANTKGVLAGAGFMMRFHSFHRRMKDLVAQGRLGTVVSVRTQLSCWYPEIEGAWRQKKALSGGGALMDMAVHCVDLIQYVLGSKVVSVAALAGTRVFSYEVEDSGTLLMRTESGAYCTVEAYFTIPDSAARGRFEVYGTGGSMLAEGTIGQDHAGRLELLLSDSGKGYDPVQARANVASRELELEAGNLYTREIESFSASIREGKPVEVPLDDALQVQSVVEAAYESARTQKFIRPAQLS